MKTTPSEWLCMLYQQAERALEFIFMKPSPLLAVALLAFGVWAWHVVPDYVSSSPRSAATDSACRCEGCGCKGGPGWRGQNGQCV
jgi:hypothetical protein